MRSIEDLTLRQQNDYGYAVDLATRTNRVHSSMMGLARELAGAISRGNENMGHKQRYLENKALYLFLIEATSELMPPRAAFEEPPEEAAQPDRPSEPGVSFSRIFPK